MKKENQMEEFRGVSLKELKKKFDHYSNLMRHMMHTGFLEDSEIERLLKAMCHDLKDTSEQLPKLI